MAARKKVLKKPEVVEDPNPVTRTVDSDGSIRYRRKDGTHHRLDGPAIELRTGQKYYMQEGKYHNEDGPAMVEADDRLNYYYLFGANVTAKDVDTYRKRRIMSNALSSLEKFSDKFKSIEDPSKAGIAIMNFLQGECSHSFLNDKNECELCDNM